MSSFAPRAAILPATAADPSKHVNYNLGMVLGVDDFTQEFAYLSGRDQWLARDLLGYGTVWGLRVSTEIESRGPRLVVDSGVAVSPRGQLIRVPCAQCAFFNDWLNLERTRTELVSRLGSPPGEALTLYVVLCYRDCPTDKVPIPGEPCRSEEDLLVPSRLADDFVLELRFSPPDQREEDALRDFVAWLSQIDIADPPGPFTPLEDFIEAVRNAAQPSASPPSSPPDFMFGSPPASLRIPRADACTYLRAAFRVWTTELRPRWRPRFDRATCGDTPLSQSDPEGCVLLAEVVLPVIRTPDGDWAVDDTLPILVNEERRPFLLHLRFLQEWLLCGRHETAASLESPPSGMSLPGDSVMPETAFDLAFDAGVAAEHSRADHTHGTPPDPIPGHRADPSAHLLAGDVTGDIASTTVARLQNVDVDTNPPADGQVLTFVAAQNRWQAANLPGGPAPTVPADTVVSEIAFGQTASGGVSAAYSRGDHTHGTPPLPNLGGDVTGGIGNTTVVRLRNVNVAATAPTSNQVLTFQGGQWRPANLPQAPAGEFVEHPAGAGPYAIVAAGIVGLAQSLPPIYNNLKVVNAGQASGVEALLEITFDGYKQPSGEHQYIVKALPVFDIELKFGVVVYFDHFEEQFFVLRLISFTGDIPRDLVPQIKLMIEVSQYPFP
ncbi:MAG TPA: hypothetical protein VLK82_24755, partial [Candidatus Tectomicrobia bacterium]|nr:hypothetical protein [Candidatus Tectomicrobia bacterium]